MARTRTEHTVSPSNEPLRLPADRTTRRFLPLAGGTLTGNLTINGSGSDLIPEASDQNRLGRSDRTWEDLWVDDIAGIQSLSGDSNAPISVFDDLNPSTGGTKDLGVAAEYWQFGFIDSLNSKSLIARTATQIAVAGDPDPGSDDTYNLGSASLTWDEIYVNDVHVSRLYAISNTIDVQDNMSMGANSFVLLEMTAPQGHTNGAKLYAKLNGSLTELRVIFQDNTDVLLATEV